MQVETANCFFDYFLGSLHSRTEMLHSQGCHCTVDDMASEQPRRPTIPQREGAEGSSRASSRDGLSLYRSISRQLHGDPLKYEFVLNAVLDHFLRVWIQPSHDKYGLYCKYREEWPCPSRAGTFFGALACPDLGASQGDVAFVSVLSVITNALNIRLVIWPSLPNSGTKPLNEVGPVACPEYHLLQSKAEDRRLGFCYDSLLEDESGQALVALMRRYKGQKILPVKEIGWYGFGPEGGRPQCYNEYRSVSIEPLDTLVKFTFGFNTRPA